MCRQSNASHCAPGITWKFLFRPGCIFEPGEGRGPFPALDDGTGGSVVAHLLQRHGRTQHSARELLAAFGVVFPDPHLVVRGKPAIKSAEALPALARRAINDLLDQLRVLDERIGGYDRVIEAQAKLSEAAQRLMQIRGIGPTTALAIVATVGDAREFKNGRQFAAWIGLVPGQYSTGGKTRLGHISKRVDPVGTKTKLG